MTFLSQFTPGELLVILALTVGALGFVWNRIRTS